MVLLILVLGAGVALGVGYCRRTDQATSTKDKKAKDGHGDHEEHASVIQLSDEQVRLAKITLDEAKSGLLRKTLTLPGEIQLNADHVAHIVPKVSGVVRDVRKKLGDQVVVGDVLAVLESRELADAKAADLAARARLDLARSNLQRIQTLFDKKIAPEEELLKVRQAMAEVDIEHITAEAKLHALGLTEEEVKSAHIDKDVNYALYELRAPFAGTIVEKHISLGEMVTPESDAFLLADLSTVWARITVYARDLPRIKVGAPVVLTAPGLQTELQAEITYVSPTIDEQTRSGFAQAVVPNTGGNWRPGQFVSAAIETSSQEVAVLIPNTALQAIGSDTVVFVKEKEGFVKRSVVIGQNSGAQSEIISGLSPRETFVAKGAFILKAELGKGEAKHEH